MWGTQNCCGMITGYKPIFRLHREAVFSYRWVKCFDGNLRCELSLVDGNRNCNCLSRGGVIKRGGLQTGQEAHFSICYDRFEKQHLPVQTKLKRVFVLIVKRKLLRLKII